MTIFLLTIYIIFISYLSLYSLIFIYLSIKIWFVKQKENNKITDINYGDISILVPAYNEGEALLDTIKTITNQNYSGKVKIYILANNTNDNFVIHLNKNYNCKKIDDITLELAKSEKREIYLIYTSFIQKKDKINFWLPFIDTQYTGILDADHRVESNWISSSLSKMDDDTKIVQSRRQPLNISTIFQMWDSAQNHIGNEILNNILSEKNNSVFFTGTTCIFLSDIIKKYKFNNCLTEDTYLSYDLICDGYNITYNGSSSSYEEVAFDSKSYVFRRRRWSAGHNKTFFDHIKKILFGNFNFITKIKLFLHGQFFLIPIIVVFLLNTVGIYFLLQFTKNIQIATIIISALLSFALSGYFKKKGNNIIIDSIVSFLWIFPQISILAIWFYKILSSEIYYYIISFPFKKYFFTLEIILILIPLLVIISGLFFFRQYKIKNLLLIPTYPIFMFLDIWAYFLGFVDFILKKYNWVEIKRQNFISDEIVPDDIKSQIDTGVTIKKNYKKIIWFSVVVISIIIINDLLAFNNCGEIRKFIWKPIFIKPTSSTLLNFNIEKSLSGTSTINILIENSVSTDKEVTIENYLDGEKMNENKITTKYTDKQTLSFPLGWESHKIDVIIKGSKINCEQTKYFSTTYKEIRENLLFINGEKFLIKGIIPSFSNKLTNLKMDKGLQEIKETGANTIRFYHYINNEIKDTSSKYNLMIINQPDKSTWGEINFNNSFDQKKYIARYKKMIKNNEGYPFILFNIFGNEWELGDNNQNKIIPKIKQIINELSTSTNNEITSYSTYLTFVNYPVDILGINMLDTGNTYWNKAINILKNTNKPFYASEFGGFVAFWETVPTDLRIARINEYWNILMKNNSLGAVFFESHDNWAQPVASGYNDPFKSEQPDDLRGLWDKNNSEKEELRFLKELFSDFNIELSKPITNKNLNEINLTLKNKRDYYLKNVTLNYYQDKKIIVGDFNPLETKIVKIEFYDSKLPSKLYLNFDYTTHSGFKEFSSNELVLPIIKDIPVITNNDFIKLESSTSSIKGRLIFSNKIELVLPTDWNSFEFNNNIYKNNINNKNILLIENPYHKITNLKISTDNYNWQNFDSNKINNGIYYIKFKIPEINSSKKYLVLSGLGSDLITYNINGKTGNIRTHNYRENVIDLSIFKEEDLKKEITILINRNQTGYISKLDSPNNQEISIDMEKPIIFAPIDINIKKYN